MKNSFVDGLMNQILKNRIEDKNKLIRDALVQYGYEFETEADLIKFISENIIVFTDKGVDEIIKTYFLDDGDKLSALFATKESILNSTLSFDLKMMHP